MQLNTYHKNRRPAQVMGAAIYVEANHTARVPPIEF